MEHHVVKVPPDLIVAPGDPGLRDALRQAAAFAAAWREGRNQGHIFCSGPQIYVNFKKKGDYDQAWACLDGMTRLLRKDGYPDSPSPLHLPPIRQRGNTTLRVSQANVSQGEPNACAHCPVALALDDAGAPGMKVMIRHLKKGESSTVSARLGDNTSRFIQDFDAFGESANTDSARELFERYFKDAAGPALTIHWIRT